MTALWTDPAPQVLPYRTPSKWRPCDWCGRYRNVVKGRPNVCLDCQGYEQFAQARKEVAG